MINKDADLKVLFPDEDLIIEGELITVKPFSFGKIPKIIKQASSLIQIVMSMPPGLLSEEGEFDVEDPATAIILASMLEQGGGAVFEILSLATNKPVAWVENLAPDDGILLIMKVWSVNKDFFSRRLGPMLSSLNIPMLKTGQTPPTREEKLSVN